MKSCKITLAEEYNCDHCGNTFFVDRYAEYIPATMMLKYRAGIRGMRMRVAIAHAELEPQCEMKDAVRSIVRCLQYSAGPLFDFLEEKKRSRRESNTFYEALELDTPLAWRIANLLSECYHEYGEHLEVHLEDGGVFISADNDRDGVLVTLEMLLRKHKIYEYMYLPNGPITPEGTETVRIYKDYDDDSDGVLRVSAGYMWSRADGSIRWSYQPPKEPGV